MQRVPNVKKNAPAPKPGAAKPAAPAAKPAQKVATPAPKPAATKTAPTAAKPAPKAEPKKAEIVKLGKDDKPAGAIQKLGGFLAEIGDYTPGEVPLPEPRSSFPWIGFYHENSSRADEIVEALGGCAAGEPYIAFGGAYYSAFQFAFYVLAARRYWCTTDKANDIVHCTLDDPGFRAKDPDGDNYKDSAVVILLVVPGAEPLPEEFGPALLVIADFRGTKSPCVVEHLREVEKSMTAEWCQAHGDLASSVPPKFRVASMFKIKSKPARGKSFGYDVAHAKTSPSSPTQIEAVALWGVDEEKKQEFVAAQEEFTDRVAALAKLAGVEPSEESVEVATDEVEETETVGDEEQTEEVAETTEEQS